ncbi:transposase [Sesbania bispinosa]|nr:transposase [Sesbania bispinosa]
MVEYLQLMIMGPVLHLDLWTYFWLKTYRVIIKSDQLLHPVVAQPGCVLFKRTETSDPCLTNSLWKFNFMAFGHWWHNLGAVVALAQKNRSEEGRKQHDAREEKKPSREEWEWKITTMLPRTSSR